MDSVRRRTSSRRWRPGEGREVYAFTSPGDRAAQEFARGFGAVWAGASTEAPPAPLDAAIIFAPVGALVPEALSRVVPGGTVVCAGIHMSDLPSFPYRLLWEERVVRSVANLTRQDAEDFLAAGRPEADRNVCDPVSARRGQSRARRSSRRARSGRCGDRPVPAMTAEEQKVSDRLRTLGLSYERYEHPPVATAEEGDRHWAGIDAVHCKNLFLRNQKGTRHYLVIVVHSKRVDLRAVADQIGDGKLSFASPERFMEYLGVTPGSVSPMGLINDREHHVRVFLDRDLRSGAAHLVPSQHQHRDDHPRLLATSSDSSPTAAISSATST